MKMIMYHSLGKDYIIMWMLRVQNCTTILESQGIYPAPAEPIGIIVKGAGTPSDIKKKKKKVNKTFA